MSATEPAIPMSGFVRRVLVALLLLGLALLLWRAASILILLFGAILVAILLRGLADRLSAHTPMPPLLALCLVLIVILSLILASAWLFGSQIAGQFSDLIERLPDLVARAKETLSQSRWGQFLVEQIRGMSPDGSGVVSTVTTILRLALEIVANLVLVLFVGLYLAFQPRLYRKGVLLLAPRDRQKELAELLDANGQALWLWLIGQFAAMVLVGLVTFAGLSLLGMPMALALALLAGFLDFVPVVGPVVAAVPGILVGLSQSPTMALYAALVYLVVQQVEGNIILPIVQRKAVSLPPVVTLASIAFFGLLFGPIGILFATPLAVVAYVTINITYVGRVLGHPERITKFQR